MQKKFLFITLALTTMHSALPMDVKPVYDRQAQVDKELRKYAHMLWVEKVEECLKQGANPNLIDIYMGFWINSYPLLIAIIEGYPNSENQEKVIGKLLEYHAYVNSSYFWDSPCSGKKFGPPALILAAQKNLPKICKLLLEKKADVNAVSHGMTALMWAKENKNVELANLLRAKGADEHTPKKKPGCFERLLNQCSLQ